MVKPITPDEVNDNQKIPDEVIEVFNELIVANIHNGKATILQKDASEKIRKKMQLTNVNEIYEKHYLDVEDIYREAGWRVNYYQPTFSDPHFESYFTFEK